MSAIEGVVAYQRWSLRGVPLYIFIIVTVLLAVLRSLQSFSTMDHLVLKLSVTLLSTGKTDSIFSMLIIPHLSITTSLPTCMHVD